MYEAVMNDLFKEMMKKITLFLHNTRKYVIFAE